MKTKRKWSSEEKEGLGSIIFNSIIIAIWIATLVLVAIKGNWSAAIAIIMVLWLMVERLINSITDFIETREKFINASKIDEIS